MMKLSPIRLNNSEPVSRQIFNHLKKQIVEIKVSPGTRLSENELSSIFNVSRQPVREALFLLKQVGLIEVFPQKGSYVTKISAKNLKETCFLRSSVECSAVFEGIKNKDEERFNAIIEDMKDNLALQRRLLEKPNDNDRDGRFLELDDAFHHLICRLSGTNLAWEVIESYKSNIDRIRFLSTQRVSSMPKLVEEHTEICRLIEKEQALDATQKLHEHLYEITKTWGPILEQNAECFEKN